MSAWGGELRKCLILPINSCFLYRFPLFSILLNKGLDFSQGSTYNDGVDMYRFYIKNVSFSFSFLGDNLMAKKNSSRINITVPSVTREAVEALAEIRGSSISETIKVFIERELAIEAIVNMGSEVIARDIKGNEQIIASSEFWISSNGRKLLNST